MRFPTKAAPPPSLTTCFGGGGAFGIAFNLGVAHGLQDAGIPIHRGTLMGTSAGSWAAASVATDMSLEDLVPTWTIPSHGDLRRRAITSTAQLWSARHDERVIAVAAEVPLVRRRLLSARRHSLADIVAASSSLPGLAAPHRIGNRFYVDAGLMSPASVDRAPKANLLVVVVPIAAGTLGGVGIAAEAITRFETSKWTLRHRRPSLFLRPDQRFRPYLRRFSDLMQVEHVYDIYREARTYGFEHGHHYLDTWVAASRAA
jgi:predicted acylesterase/phospholipase RssA